MSMHAGAHTVRIHVDHEPYQAPSSTNGEALYALAGIPQHLELFKELNGNQEDQLVTRDAHHLELAQDEHFYSQRTFTIAVNTEQKEIAKRRLSFDDLIRLEFGVPPEGPNIKITVDYSNGPAVNPKGSLRHGQSVRVRNGMEFDVSATDRS